MKKINLSKVFFCILALIIVVAAIIIGFPKTASPEELTGLLSLPYLSYSEQNANINLKGTTYNDFNKSFEGYNLYSKYVIDMNGTEIFRFPERTHQNTILEDGFFISGLISRNITFHNKSYFDWDAKLVLFDKDNRPVWRKDIPVHHAIHIYNNSIFTISVAKQEYMNRSVNFDMFYEINISNGEIIENWSTYEHLAEIQKYHQKCLLDNPNEKIPIDIDDPHVNPNDNRSGHYDYYHANSITILPENILGVRNKSFQEGNWLISLCFTDLILILDKDTKEIVWSYGPGILEKQHSPQMLENGNIIIFDNGVFRKSSRVIEIDPTNKKIVWEYNETDHGKFYTQTRGYAQRLPNNNTLITESEKGHIFEVTPDKEIVWEWYNPQINDENKRKTIDKMIRLSKQEVESFRMD